MFVAGGRNETKKRRLLKLIKQQLFALSATRSIGFCIKLPVPVVTVSAPLSGSRSAIAASASSACCQRPQAWQYAASTITSMAVSRPRTCSWGATLHHSSLAAGIKKPGGAGGAGGIGGAGSRKSIRLFPGLPRTILSRVGVGESR